MENKVGRWYFAVVCAGGKKRTDSEQGSMKVYHKHTPNQNEFSPKTHRILDALNSVPYKDGHPTLCCSSSIISLRLCWTLLADSLLAMRRLTLRRSASVSSGALGSPLYVIGLPTFFFGFIQFCVHTNFSHFQQHSYSPKTEI